MCTSSLVQACALCQPAALQAGVAPDKGTGRTIVMAPKGHLQAQRLQPVHDAVSCRTDDFLPRTVCRLNRCSSHVGTHQPQPVQRLGSICGRRAAGRAGTGVVERGMPASVAEYRAEPASPGDATLKTAWPWPMNGCCPARHCR